MEKVNNFYVNLVAKECVLSYESNFDNYCASNYSAIKSILRRNAAVFIRDYRDISSAYSWLPNSNLPYESNLDTLIFE